LNAITTPEGLAEWQGRLGITDAEAARRLGIPYLSYREYLPGGRRRRSGLPGWMPVLCGFLEREAARTKAGSTAVSGPDDQFGEDWGKLRDAVAPFADFARALSREGGTDDDVVARVGMVDGDMQLRRGDLCRLRDAYDATAGQAS
jgi:hypothetical protein